MFCYLNLFAFQVPIFKHNSSTNIPMMSNHTEDQRGMHSYSMTNSDFMKFQEKGQPKNTGTYVLF